MKTQARCSVFDWLGSPAGPTVQRAVSQQQPFRAGTDRGARHRPYPLQRKMAWKALSDSSAGQRWRGLGGGSPGRLCPTVEESAGHLSGHQHSWGRGGHHFPSKTSAHPPVHQLPDQDQPSRPPAGRGCLAVEGGLRAGHLHDFPRVLQPAVPGYEKDRRSSSGGHSQAVSPCPDAQGRKKVSAFCGQQASLPFHLSTLRIGNFTSGVHPAFTPDRSSVKTTRCEAAHLLRHLVDPCRYSRTGPTACPDYHQCAPVSQLDHQLREVRLHSKSGLPVHRDAVQHSIVHSGAPTEDASLSPVRSPTLDDQPKHHSPRSAQITGHAGVYGFTGTIGKTSSSSVPVMGHHSMVPGERELDRPDHSSSVGAVRGGLVGISSSPTRSFPHHQRDGSDSLQGCIQFGLGSPVRLTLDTGTVVSISKIVAHQRSGDAGCHQCGERLPTSFEVPGGSFDVRQHSDCGAIARWSCWFPSICQESTTSRQIPWPEAPRHWTRSFDDGHGASATHVCPVGRAAGRLVCNICQQTTRQVCIAVFGPQGRVDGRHVSALG